MSQITAIQKILSVPQDDIWGPKSQTALIAAPAAQKALIQGILKVAMDGVWGPKSQTALNFAAALNPALITCEASSFADPADVAAFNRCKLTGKTDLQCFAVGDNGIGQFGQITAQEHTPMIAVHGSLMKARWGSIQGAAHRPVIVTVKGITINATVEDRISAPGRIDLNPACAKQLGLRPPFVVPCTWQWA